MIPEIYSLTLLEQTFLEFRCSVLERRAKFQLKRAEDRAHIVKASSLCKSVYTISFLLQEHKCYWNCLLEDVPVWTSL